MDDYFAGTAQRAPATAAPVYPAAPAYAPAPAYSPAPAYPPYPPVQQPWPYAGPPSSGLSGPVIALIAVVATVVVICVLTAVAIPVFLQQRDLSRRTTVSVPAEVAGLPRSTDAAGQAAEARLQALPGPGDHVAGAFGTAGTRVVVGAARYHLSSKEQDDYLSSSVTEATAQGVHLASVPPGKLGGHLRCGTSAVAPMTICVFADGGSYGVVVVTGPTDDATGTARAAREAFVHRT